MTNWKASWSFEENKVHNEFIPINNNINNNTCLLVPRNSFQCAVMSLRRLNYDRKELERRREASLLDLQGDPTLA